MEVAPTNHQRTFGIHKHARNAPQDPGRRDWDHGVYLNQTGIAEGRTRAGIQSIYQHYFATYTLQ